MEKFIIKKLPRVVRIETSSACNLRCRHCPTGTNTFRVVPSVMGMSLFDRIVEEIKKAGTVKVAVLYHGGEPFINKNLFQMIKILKEAGIGLVRIVTNGMLIGKADLENIINSGLNSIEFSLDGLSPAENGEIRTGSDFYRVINTIKELIRLKEQKRSVYPKISIANAQIPSERALKNNIKNNVPISPPKYIVDELGRLKGEVEFKCMYMIKWPGSNCDLKYKLVEFPKPLSSSAINECDHIINTITIRSNGDVVPCCVDVLSQYVIGNILKQNLEELWNNSKYLILRKSINEGKYLPLCKNCPTIKPSLYVCRV